MPIHEYRCTNCGFRHERYAATEKERVKYEKMLRKSVLCPGCYQANLKPVMPLSNFRMTGFEKE